MIKLLKTGLLCGFLLYPMLARTQTTSNNSLPINDYLRSGSTPALGVQLLGLLNPQRMTFAHSYTMSYLSSGNQSVMRGLFLETINYRLSNPLNLTLNLGYMHQPYSSFGPDGITQNSAFVGGAALTWRPAKNMFMRFEVGQYPAGSNYGYNPFWAPFPNSSPMPLQNYPSETPANPTQN